MSFRSSLLAKVGRALPGALAGSAVFVLAGAAARRRTVPAYEEAAFRGVNGLPDALHPPVWAVMQSGSLGGVGVAAGIAALAGRRPLAVELGVSGTAVWAGAKVVKRAFGRGRPHAHLDQVEVRGRPASGLGFPSGHAAVAVTLAGVAAPALPAPWRAIVWATAATTALSRVYVGAHLPADVVGGAGLGLAAASITIALADVHPRPRPRPR